MLSHVVEHMATKEDIARLDRRIDALCAKIDRMDVKLTKFEENEIDKRLQLEVRVSAIEKHLGIDLEDCGVTSASLVTGSDLFDQIDDTAPEFWLFDLREVFRER
jgi:hypothetical protein